MKISQTGCVGNGEPWLGVYDANPDVCADACASGGKKFFTIAGGDANCRCADTCEDEQGGHTSYEITSPLLSVPPGSKKV